MEQSILYGYISRAFKSENCPSFPIALMLLLGNNGTLIGRYASNELDSFVLVQGQHCQAEFPFFDACLKKEYSFATWVDALVRVYLSRTDKLTTRK